MAKTVLLVVDSDARFAAFVTQVIQPLGWHAESASNGLEALKMIETRPKRYAAVLAAINLPVLSGEELLTRIQDRGLTLPVILFSESAHLGLPSNVKDQTFTKSKTPAELISLLEGFLQIK